MRILTSQGLWFVLLRLLTMLSTGLMVEKGGVLRILKIGISLTGLTETCVQQMQMRVFGPGKPPS